MRTRPWTTRNSHGHFSGTGQSPAGCHRRREEVPESILGREKAIYEAQAADQKKPPQVVEKIVQGKLNDFYKREVLMDQPWAKDDKRTVDQMLKEGIAKLGENITISRFARFKVGEAS